MARHRKSDLLNTIVQAIRDCNWNVLYIGDIREHPFLLKIYNDESDKGYLIRVYIWHLTHGGGAKRPVDEYRIQITGIKKFDKLQGEKTLILGWWEAGKVFAGFDFARHSGTLGFSPSIQIHEEALRKAHINGIATINKGNKEIAVAFRPDFFVHYVESLEDLHNFGESDNDYAILEKILENPERVNDKLIDQVSPPRKIIASTINKKLRDTSFKSRVLTAYGFECAFCGLQLKLIDAAHLVPVSYPKSSDETCNGIALCALHHRAFDKALVTLNEEYQVIMNQEELTKLKKSGHDGELPRFIKALKPIIKVPPSVNDRPHIDYIKQANHIRGWS
jgi:putative restriction endonuclease